MDYFVDSLLGSDSNDGMKRQSAFKTTARINELVLRGGDSVLFKAGCTFEGTFAPKRKSGEGVITISRYGVGEKPVIIGSEDAAVDLTDIEGIEVRELAVTNPNGIYGVLICNKAGGEACHIHICECDIYNVYGGHEQFYINTGGITITTGKEKPGWYRDLLIQDNHIHDVCRTGVILHTFWSNRPWKTWAENDYISDTKNWWPSYKVVFRGNFIERPAGDAMVLIGAIDPLMEWNTAFHVMNDPKPHCANAGIWPQSTEGCVVQYNEVGYTHKPEGCDDAQGFDVDLSCRNTLVQYNYSHDNEGGFLLLCEIGKTEEYGFRGTIVRNNLSVNDGKAKGELFALVGPVRGVTIENNTIYSSGNVEKILEVWTSDGTDQAEDITFRNNIFISNGKGNAFNQCNGKNFIYENNLYWGTHKNVPENHINPLVADPKLSFDNINCVGRLFARNFIPCSNSPALAEGEESKQDFFGNDFNPATKGAFSAKK